MAQSGWYDDPDGTPARLRYWDGTQWTTDTMPKPDQTAVLPPVGTAYPQAGGYGQYGTQGWTPTAPQPSGPYAPQAPPRTTRRGRGALLAAGVLVLLIGLVAGVYALTKPGSGAAAAPTTRPSSTASQPADCPAPAAGRLTDGTITVTMPSTWTQYLQTEVSWSDCYSVCGRTIVKNWLTSAIVATYASDGGTSQQVAEDAWGWNVDNNYEGGSSNVTLTGDKVTKKEAVTVGGLPGYKLSGQVTISGLAGVPGDEVTILVLENADKTHSILLTTSVIGDATSKAEVESIWSSLKVA